MLPADRDGSAKYCWPDQREGALRHPALRALPLGIGGFGERAAQVDGAGASAIGVGPGDVAVDGEVDLEGRRSLPVSPIRPLDPRGHRVAVDPQCRSRIQVQHHNVGVRDVATAGDGDPGGDRAAVGAQRLTQRGGDRPRSTHGHRPAVAVAAGQEHQADRPDQRPVQPGERVGGGTAVQRARLFGAKPPRDHRRRQQSPRSERGQPKGMTRHMKDRAHQILTQLVETAGEVTDRHPPPSAVRAHGRDGSLDRLVLDTGRAVVERMRAVNLGPPPGQPVARQVDVLPDP